MSKEKDLTIESQVMGKVLSGKVKMKPRWYFVLGSLLSVTGLAGLITGATFLVNIMLFMLRIHGRGGQFRLQYMLDSFPLWIPILAVGLLILGIIVLKKYDFTYKNNFKLIVFGLIASVFLSAYLLDLSGLNDLWSTRGPIKGLYQQGRGKNYRD
jgi:uncharacterized membrane protein YozB (DUF420 family)